MTEDKQGIGDLVLFGGQKLFDAPKPVGQLDAPPVEEYLDLLQVSFDEGQLTNGGPLVQQLETRLCEYHQVSHCVAVANAALGLTMLMQLFSHDKVGEVIMPAFSYRGLPHFAQWAGQIPQFCDVDPVTHALDPQAVEPCINERTTSILTVCNFNSPGHLDDLCALGDSRNIPVIIDSVYGLGSSYKGQPLGRFGAAEVFSTHATKLLNGFEGGYITTEDDELAETLRWQRNFCFPPLQPPGACDYRHALGINAKLNELHAAMALLSLDRLDDVIARNKERYAAYQSELSRFDGLELVGYLDDEAERRNYQLAVVEIGKDWPFTRDEMLRLLKAEGAAISPYYSPPLHKSSHCPPDAVVPDLPVSEDLATRYLQLPVGELVSLEDIKALGELFLFLQDNSAAISARLGQA